MAGRRKAEIQLQMQVESQEEWEELMSKEGLNGTISEIYKNCFFHLQSGVVMIVIVW